MRLAVAGKGGVGKTSIAGTLARVLARDGHSVLAIDGDSGPNLALTLGVPAERMASLPTLPANLRAGTEDEPALSQPLDALRRACGVATPDGVELLVMAAPDEAGTGCLSGLHAAVRAIVRACPDDVCILDTDASPEGFSRGVARHVDLMLIVVEAAPASIQTARRMVALARDLGLARVELVANKVRDAGDLERIRLLAREVGVPVAGAVPFDEALGAAERNMRAPLDVAPEAPAVTAVSALALYVTSTYEAQ
jgi:CO dehydrogenase maturation factor